MKDMSHLSHMLEIFADEKVYCFQGECVNCFKIIFVFLIGAIS